MEYLILSLVSFYIGWKLAHFFIVWKSNRFIKHIQEQVSEQIEEVKKDLISVVIEKHENTFFVYDMKTNQFMAKGDSRNELEQKLGEMFPGKRFAVTPENLKEVGFF
jgi:hypothetical protein